VETAAAAEVQGINMFKTNKYIDARAMGPTQEEYDDSSESPQGGHPLIRADWKSEDSLRAATGRTWATGSAGISTGQAWKDSNGLVLVLVETAADADQSIYVRLDNDAYDAHRASYRDGLNWPSPQEFESLLEKHVSGDPYFGKLIKDDFESGDIVNAAVPGIVDTTSTTSFIDLTTEVPSPDPGFVSTINSPAFTVNIKPVYNGYNAALEETFPDTGLNETAIPNYYMLTYFSPRAEVNTIQMPMFYKEQINLTQRVDWTHGPINEGGSAPSFSGGGIPADKPTDYFLEYEKGLQNIIAGDQAAAVNSDMERYKVIAVRPQSKAGIDDLSNDEDRLRLLPYYIDLNFRSPTVYVDLNGNPADGSETPTEPIPNPGHSQAAFPWIRYGLQQTNLFDAVVSFIIERDQGMPYHDQSLVSGTYVSADNGAVSIDLMCLLTDILSPASPLLSDYAHIWGDPGVGTHFRPVFQIQGSWTWGPTGTAPSLSTGMKSSKGTYLVAPEIARNFGAVTGGTASDVTTDPGENVDLNNIAAYLNQAPSNQNNVDNQLAAVIRSFQQLLDGAPAHSETLVYKIEKRNADTGNLVQTFYMPNVDGGFRYIDSQVLYGVRYQYDIMPIRAVVGNQYQYTNLMVLPLPEHDVAGTGHALGNALGFYADTAPGSVYGPLLTTYLADAGADTGIAVQQNGRFIFKDPNARRRFMCIPGLEAAAAAYGLSGVTPSMYLDRIVLDLGLGDGVTNNVDGGATAKRIDLTLTEAQQCAGTQTIGGAMTFGSALLTHGALPMCSNGSFETWVHGQEDAGWPAPAIGWTNSGAPSNYSSRLTSNNITAEDILTAPIMQQWIGSVDISEAKRIFIDIYKGTCTSPGPAPWTYTG